MAGEGVKLECICFTSFCGLHIGYISLGWGGGRGLVSLEHIYICIYIYIYFDIYTSIQFVFIIQTGSKVFDTCVFWITQDGLWTFDGLHPTNRFIGSMHEGRWLHCRAACGNAVQSRFCRPWSKHYIHCVIKALDRSFFQGDLQGFPCWGSWW